jgi:hypothetical protein
MSSGRCAACATAYQKSYRRAHLDDADARVAAWRKAHPEKVKSLHATYRRNNRDKVVERNRAYRVKNRDKLNERSRVSRLLDPEKVKRKNAKYVAANLEKVHKSQSKASLKHKYGLSLIAWEQLLITQAGCCWLCELPMLEIPCVDHDHTTGVIRGLAHRKCNVVFGLLREDPNVLYALARKAYDLKRKHLRSILSI